MYNEIAATWSAAINSCDRKVLYQTTVPGLNGENVVKVQKIKFSCWNIEAIMEMELYNGDERKQPNQRRYKQTLIVPSTNKRALLTRQWKSTIDKLMAIIIAFTKGREHEDRLMLRRQKAIKEENESLLKDKLVDLEKTTFTKKECEFIFNWIVEHTDPRNIMRNMTVMRVFIELHNRITGRGLIELGFNLGNESNLYLDMCYVLTAKCFLCSKLNDSVRYISNTKASKLFIQENDYDSFAKHVAKMLFALTLDICREDDPHHGNEVFMFVCELFAAYYEWITNKPFQKKLEEVEASHIAWQNRKSANRFGVSNGSSVSPADILPMGTVGEEFADVLNNAIVHNDKRNGRKPNEDRKYEDGGAMPEQQPAKPKFTPKHTSQQEQPLQPIVIMTSTEEAPQEQVPSEEEESKPLGTVGDAFDKTDLG